MSGAEVLAVASVVKGVSGFAAGMQNASIAKDNSTTAIANAAENERRFRLSTTAAQGRNRALAGASGASGADVADLFGSNAMNEELDALTVRYKGAVESVNFKNQATQYKRGAVSSLIDGFTGAGTSLYGFGSGNYLGNGLNQKIAGAFSSSPTGPYQSYGI